MLRVSSRDDYSYDVEPGTMSTKYLQRNQNFKYLPEMNSEFSSKPDICTKKMPPKSSVKGDSNLLLAVWRERRGWLFLRILPTNMKSYSQAHLQSCNT